MSGNSNNNAKKKQEEKHLKLLREFLALSANKNCFDCNQRGPTYVNATIGSFVCISCSGKLRGLTPPHRVKSISMASFTPEEIDFLRSRGNEYCKQVWMALYTGDVVSETKDEQRFKDHLTAKYEKRRWYVEPSAASRNIQQVKVSGMNGGSSSSTGSSPSTSVRTPTPAPASVPAPQPSKTSDLLADLDFFSTPLTNAAPTGTPRKNPSIPQSVSQPCFANFQNADFFVASFPPNLTPAAIPPPVAQQQQLPPPQQPNGIKANGVLSPPKGPPPEDRYSALKDLDALFTTQQQADTSGSGSAINWGSSSSWNTSASSVFPLQATETQFGTPPNSTWSGSCFAVAQPAPPPAPSVHSSNPFLAATAPVTPLGQVIQPANLAVGQALPWANFSSSSHNQFSAFNNANGLGRMNGMNSAHAGVSQLTTSQSLNLSPKTWSSPPAGHNPFMENSSFANGRSHNPFL